MKHISKALLWAGAILALAGFANWTGMDKSASFALVSGLSAAAWATLSGASTRCASSRCM